MTAPAMSRVYTRCRSCAMLDSLPTSSLVPDGRGGYRAPIAALACVHCEAPELELYDGDVEPCRACGRDYGCSVCAWTGIEQPDPAPVPRCSVEECDREGEYRRAHASTLCDRHAAELDALVRRGSAYLPTLRDLLRAQDQ